MLEWVFSGIFDSTAISAMTVDVFLKCLGTSLVIGILLACVYTYKARHTRSFVMTLALIPVAVCLVIMMVNGNIGTGVAVAGAFSLIRFRSVPGTAKEIGAIFLAMGAGLATGMGYLGYAVLYTLIMSAVWLVFMAIDFGENKKMAKERILRVTIPEDLDYTDMFEEVFAEYTKSHERISVKTTNLGSLFKLTYYITLKDEGAEKKFIDELRCRNGNLEINIARQEEEGYEL